MPLETFPKFYTRGLVRRHPECFFVFGDNVERRGTKGQAVIRGLPNAIGIATKWGPYRDTDAYFYDDQWERIQTILERDLNAVEHLLQSGRTVYLPTQMIGSGLAELPSRAPKVFEYLDNNLKRMYNAYRDKGLEAFFV
jgi:hypothetical protein